MTAEFADKWARWLLHGRYGGDKEALRKGHEALGPIRDRVLLGGGVEAGDVVVDVGCGDGLIGFGALPLVGEAGQVIFTDISDQLLEHCRQLASELGVADRCRFFHTPAETLESIDDSSVDVVTTRSVLIYVDNKAAAFEAFKRVLKPGGRLSLFEPINRRYISLTRDTLFGFNAAPVADLAAKVRAVFEAAAPPDGPMMGFDETDLLQFSEGAGFTDINVALELSSRQPSPFTMISWTQLLEMSPQPNAPSYGEAIHQTLSTEQAEQLELYLRPLMAEGTGGRSWSAISYLTAKKPMPVGS